jgi:hypothetical protein
VNEWSRGRCLIKNRVRKSSEIVPFKGRYWDRLIRHIVVERALNRSITLNISFKFTLIIEYHHRWCRRTLASLLVIGAHFKKLSNTHGKQFQQASYTLGIIK